MSQDNFSTGKTFHKLYPGYTENNFILPRTSLYQVSSQTMQQFIATKAFVTNNGKVLLLRESSTYKDGSNAGKFDVVGGRLAPGERFDGALLREAHEETGLTVQIGRPFYVGEWRPVVRNEEWQIVGTFFECPAESDLVVLSEDHQEHQWIDPNDYMNYPLIDNLKPAFEAYLNR